MSINLAFEVFAYLVYDDAIRNFEYRQVVYGWLDSAMEPEATCVVWNGKDRDAIAIGVRFKHESDAIMYKLRFNPINRYTDWPNAHD
jgi:hypothetical protein